MLATQRRVKPRLEALEERCVPTVTYDLSSNGNLTITSDDSPHTFVLLDTGNNVTGNVRVRQDGVLQPAFSGPVVSVRLVGGSAQDIVVYDLTADLQAASRPRTVVANLGSGNNAFFANINGNITTGATLRFFVFGLDGNDLISFNAATPTDVQSGAKLQFNAWGLTGNDLLLTNYVGVDDGELDVFLSGGPGNDLVQANVVLQSGSSGIANVELVGRAGNDSLQLLAFTQSGLFVNASVDGGDGTDTAVITSNVSQTNVESTTTVDG